MVKDCYFYGEQILAGEARPTAEKIILFEAYILFRKFTLKDTDNQA